MIKLSINANIARRVIFLTLIAECCFFARVLAADPFDAPDINECGAIATNRPLPTFELRNTRLKLSKDGPDGPCDGVITMILKGHGETILQTYLANPDAGADWDPKAEVDWDYVSGRRVALGWLAGATNLLLVSWRDASASHGNGVFVFQNYLVLRVFPGKCISLLTARTLSLGRAIDVSQGCGYGQHYFTFDASTQTLTNRATFSRDLLVGNGVNIPPLHHQATEGDHAATETWIAAMREIVIYRYRCGTDRVTRLGVALCYTTQKNDNLTDIAHFYLGALAPYSVILKANPQLIGKVGGGSDYELGHDPLPKDTLVKIPVPEEWIVDFYR